MDYVSFPSKSNIFLYFTAFFPLIDKNEMKNQVFQGRFFFFLVQRTMQGGLEGFGPHPDN